MISCRNVSKDYGNFRALDGLNLEVGPGEIYGLIGPNGAGKTTTIKLLVGLLKPSTGTILINGINITRDGIEAKKIIGYIPDEPFLYERLTPSELMHFKGSLHGMTKEAIERAKAELLEMVGMVDHQNDLIESFSLGMRQRLAIAVALLPSPSIIIVDEPLVGLDPSGMKRVKEIFASLAHEGRTVFISTHMLNVVEELSTRVGVLNRGKLIVEGTVETLKNAEDEKLESVFFRLFQEVAR